MLIECLFLSCFNFFDELLLQQMKNQRYILAISAVLMAFAALRLLINIPNFSPIGAIALMGGALLFRNKLGLIITFGVLIISDFLMASVNSMYSEYLFSATMLTVYFSFLVIFFLGKRLANNLRLTNVVLFSFLAAVVFFLVTNAASWMVYEFYPKTFSGLLMSYEAGLPFFRNTLVSQLVFSVAIYGVYYFVLNGNSRKQVA
jgi:hypothetical protein